MYQDMNRQLIFSPSDLVLSMRSTFASWMERFALERPEIANTLPQNNDPMLTLLAAKGIHHERRMLASFQARFGEDKVGIVIGKTQAERSQQTLAFMMAGVPVIYQAQLSRDNFAGSADFLVKAPGQSNLGDWHYETWDAKLALSIRHFFVLQLCGYSWMLEGIQGRRPDEAAIILGQDSGTERFRLACYYDFFIKMKAKFLVAQERFVPDLNAAPNPAFDSEYGRWTSYAEQRMQNADSLALVANIRKSQIKKLNKAGITTMTQLAAWPAEEVVKGLPPSTLANLAKQANIQHRSKGLERPLVALRETESGKGLSALPPASSLDIYFDIEGHPLFEGGLEYLWGVSYRCPEAPIGKQYAFKDWWAHTAEQEQLAFEGFMDWAYARWQRDPTLHIYHYANYEVNAIKRLSAKYETRLQEAAELLANGVLVDLYKIIREGFWIGEGSYSIKKVEHLYRGKRTTDVVSGGDSVVAYELWRQHGGVERWNQAGFPIWRQNPGGFDWTGFPELNDIRLYNIDDCESTLELVDWLRTQQQIHGIAYAPVVKDETQAKEMTARQLNYAEKKQELRNRIQRLIDRFQCEDRLKSDSCASLMVDLLGFHSRERKPKIWTYFDRLGKAETELYDDDSCVQGITVTAINDTGKGIMVTGVFDRNQPIRKDKLQTGSLFGSGLKVKNIGFGEGELENVIEFLADTSGNQPVAFCEGQSVTLLGDEPYINTDMLETRLCEVCEAVFDGQPPPQTQALLTRIDPVFKGEGGYLPIERGHYPDEDDYLEAIIQTTLAMDRTCLSIQGPPGAGKTFTASHIIKALVRDGNRVGILSTSHNAIRNLLDAYYKLDGTVKVAKIGGLGSNQDTFREKYPEEDFPNYVYRPQMNFTKKQPFDSFTVVGGTAYAFASDVAFENPVDYLMVDEASQVPLANLVAVAGTARNIILLGDQMQLEQPRQGSHPENAGLSSLEYLLEGHRVVPGQRGIFLERTYRMHPSVCRPLSDIVYEGKLHAAPGNDRQQILVPDGRLVKKSHGILLLDVPHEFNTQSSIEECNAINALIDELKSGVFVDKFDVSRPVTDSDILVVAPYNMQVNLLKEQLRHGCPVGTIDKFQGQEAPVVIVSMAISDVEDSPRGLDFVFDINRLNVAISRAKALAFVLANPGLRDCRVTNLQQMAKVSFYCALCEQKQMEILAKI